MTRTWALALAFSAGCAAGWAMKNFVVPPARAGDGKRWEYFCFDEKSYKDGMTKANQAGQQGWELVSAPTLVPGPIGTDNPWCFKRSL